MQEEHEQHTWQYNVAAMIYKVQDVGVEYFSWWLNSPPSLRAVR